MQQRMMTQKKEDDGSIFSETSSGPSFFLAASSPHRVEEGFRPVNFVGDGPLFLIRHPLLTRGFGAEAAVTKDSMTARFKLSAIVGLWLRASQQGVAVCVVGAGDRRLVARRHVRRLRLAGANGTACGQSRLSCGL